MKLLLFVLPVCGSFISYEHKLTFHLVFLVLRLLASTEHDSVCTASLCFLKCARDAALNWVHALSEEIHAVSDEALLPSLRLQICEAAMTCKATYDIDRKALLSTVFRDPKSLITLIECSMAINMNIPQDHPSTNPSFNSLCDYNYRLSHTLEPYVHEMILSDSTALHVALAEMLPSYRPRGGHWKSSTQTYSSWLQCLTSTESPLQCPQTLHVNIITGQILLDGVPIDRLPKEITCHPTYTRLFGQVSTFRSVLHMC